MEEEEGEWDEASEDEIVIDESEAPLVKEEPVWEEDEDEDEVPMFDFSNLLIGEEEAREREERKREKEEEDEDEGAEWIEFDF